MSDEATIYEDPYYNDEYIDEEYDEGIEQSLIDEFGLDRDG